MPIKKQFPEPDTSKLNEAREFSTLKDFLSELLKQKINFVVMRNWEDAENESSLGPDSDMDILIDDNDLPRFHSAIRPISPNAAMHITLRLVKIGKSYLKLDVRSPHDHYLPLKLAQEMLKNKKKLGLIFIPDKKELFWSLLYHSLFQKPVLSDKYEQKLMKIMPTDFPIEKLRDRKFIKNLFESKGYTLTEPYDEWVWWVYKDNSDHYPEWSSYELK